MPLTQHGVAYISVDRFLQVSTRFFVRSYKTGSDVMRLFTYFLGRIYPWPGAELHTVDEADDRSYEFQLDLINR